MSRLCVALAAAVLLAGCDGPDAQKSLAAGTRYAEQHEFDKAVIEFKNALQAKPDLAQARFALGHALLENGEAIPATLELVKALDLGHPADQVAPLLAKAYIRAGQPRKALELETSAKLQSPEGVAALSTQLAAAHAELGNAERAEALLAKALELSPSHVPARLLRARSLEAKGDRDAARRIVDDVLERTPTDFDARMLKAQTLFRKGDFDGGTAELKKVLTARPGFLPAHSALLEHYLAKSDYANAKEQLEALKKVKRKHARAIYFEARLAAQQGDLNAADEHIKQLLKAGSRNLEVLHLAGVIALRRGELANAEQHFNKILQMAPEAGTPRHMLARVALRRGEPAQALKVLQPLVDAPRPDPTSLLLAGTARLMSADAKGAEQLFSRASKEREGDPAAQVGLARARLMRGDPGALDRLDSMASADAGDTVDEALIAAYLSRRDFDGALRAADRLAGKLPGKPAPLHLRGVVLEARGDLGGARANYEKALSIDAGYFAATDSLIALELRENRFAEARKRIDLVLKANATNSRALLALAVLEERTGKPTGEVAAAIGKAISADPGNAALRIKLVDYYTEKGEANAALAAAQDAAAALPGDANVLDALARTQLATGDVQQAITTYRKLASLRPTSADPWVGLAAAQLASKNPNAALESAQRALALGPDLPAPNRVAVSAMLAAGKPDDAARLARGLASRRPEMALGDQLLGDVERSRGRPREAAATYQAAFRKQSTSPLAQKLHAAHVASGAPSQANALAQSWLKDRPKDVGFLLHLGIMATSAQDHAAAAERYQQVVELAPNNAVALNNLALALRSLKKPGGLPYAERANQLRPGNPVYMDTLAVLLAESGAVSKALEIQRQAVAKARDDGELRLTLARLLLQAGQRDQAREELERLRTLGDRFAKQRDVRDLLAKL
jgi:putative PEP-CTERM system TPR-repeat lipoprotein